MSERDDVITRAVKVDALKLCIEQALTGFYLRVLEEGVIQAGDAIEAVSSDSAAPTVDAIHRLYYLDRKNRDGLVRAVACDRLADAFRDDFRARLARLEENA